MGGFKRGLSKLDAFPKINEDFFTRTISGGIVSIVSTIFMIVLFVSELRLYMETQVSNELTVDNSRGDQLQINLDITFPHISCSMLSLDAMDVSGEQHVNVVQNIFKRRLDEQGQPIEVGIKDDVGVEDSHLPRHKNGTKVGQNETYCGSCYGAEHHTNDCCNTCEAVREAYRLKGWAFSHNQLEGIEQCVREGFVNDVRQQDGEGCNIYGYLEVNKVAGNFHFAPGKSFLQGAMHVHDLMQFHGVKKNLTHTINKLSFGADFPGNVNPLDQVARVMGEEEGMFQYFVKVVPTQYKDVEEYTLQTNQFSVTEHFRPIGPALAGQALPGVFIFYDLSPIKVLFTETHRSFLHFLTSMCAIIGGVFTVSGIIDAFVYHGHKAIKKKMELGKLS